MKRFTDAGRRAVSNQNLYAALSLALTIPDICGSLEDPGPGKTQARYVNWCKRWVEPKYTSPEKKGRSRHIFLSAEDCFQLRCSLIHSGSAIIASNKQVILSRIEFFDTTANGHCTWVSGCTVNGVAQPNFLQLKADLFSIDLFDAADEWDDSVKNDAAIQAEKTKLLVIRSADTSIGGIMF